MTIVDGVVCRSALPYDRRPKSSRAVLDILSGDPRTICPSRNARSIQAVELAKEKSGTRVAKLYHEALAVRVGPTNRWKRMSLNLPTSSRTAANSQCDPVISFRSLRLGVLRLFDDLSGGRNIAVERGLKLAETQATFKALSSDGTTPASRASTR